MTRSVDKRSLLSVSNVITGNKLTLNENFIGQHKLLKVKDTGVSPVIPYGMFYKRT